MGSLRLARSLGVLGVALLAAAAWLLWPVHAPSGAPRARPLRVCIFDASASVVRARPDWDDWAAATLSSEARAAHDAGEDLCALRFAADRVLLFGPRDPRDVDTSGLRGARAFEPRATDPVSAQSDAAGALRLAAGIARDVPRPGGRVRTYTDSRWTSGPAAGDLAALEALGFTLEFPPLPLPVHSDLAVRALRAAEEVEAGAPIAVQAELELALGTAERARRVSDPGGRDFELELELETPRGRDSRRVAGVLPPGAPGETVAFPVYVDLGPATVGLTRVRARARLRGDVVPENDEARCAITSRGSATIAVVSTPAADAFARAWLAGQETPTFAGLDFAFADAAELPQLLERCAALITIDLAPRDLPEVLLASFVRAGGGWLACGGFGLLGGWSEADAGAPAAELLPLAPAAADRPPRDVVLLVDGSGSMAGEPFDALREAALDLCERVPAGDRLTLRIFTDRLEPELALRESNDDTAAARERTARHLAARLPGGRTDIAGALAELAAERERAARPALLLLLTDGRDQPADAAEAARLFALRARLSAASARLAVFAIGERAELEFLERLLLPGEQLQVAPSPRELTDLFQRELERERVRSGEALAIAPADPATLEPASLGAELASSWAGTALPPLRRFWRARAQPSAQILARSAEGEPVLAVARAGLGIGAVWTSAPFDDWAPAWSTSPARLGPLLRTLARGRSSGHLPVRLTVENGRATLEHVPLDWPARVLARFRRAGESDVRAELWLDPPVLGFPGAGGDPRDSREGRFSDRADFASVGSVASVTLAAGPDEPAALAEAVCALPGSGEFDAAVARVLPIAPRAGPAPTPARPPVSHPLAPWVLAAGLVSIAAAVALGWERRRGSTRGRGGSRARTPARAGNQAAGQVRR